MIDPNKLLRTWLITPQVTLPVEGTLINPVLSVLANQTGNTTGPTPAVPWPITPIFAGHLPEKYDPRPTGNGLAIVIRGGGSGVTYGGTAHTEIPIIDPRMEIICWGGNNEFEKARSVDRAIFDWIHAKSALDLGDVGFVINSLNLVLGQDVYDTSGLASIVSFYHLTLREN
jgi:hypothetical protein